ncbi:hypothetical protein DL767_011274 [Monosporascus sp. MG133]|nr:hypothetical protein DL767_011274 [Monosporascus sp. MG133]
MVQHSNSGFLLIHQRAIRLSVSIKHRDAAANRTAVSITPNSPSVPFAERPQVLMANLGGEFRTAEGSDTVFPDPGPDVEWTGAKTGPLTYCASERGP